MTPIETLLQRYKCQSLSDYHEALRESIQKIALLGLWRAKFYEHAAFYGGTALRLLYGLNRFSEDLDFSLLKTTESFSLSPYNKAIQAELESFGFETHVTEKEKTAQTKIKSAFIKANTKQHLIHVNAPKKFIHTLNHDQKLKVKIEVDIDPPGNFQTHSELLLEPLPFSVLTFSKEDLFAGKIHAILCRGWLNRVKGRDWYDLVWFVTQNISLNLSHLKQRLIQSGHLEAEEPFSQREFWDLYTKRLQQIDFEHAKTDILPFIKDPISLDLWSASFFEKVGEKIRIIEP